MIANAVMGLLPQPMVAPVAGAIVFQGHDLLALAEPQWRALRGNRIGMIFQDPMSALNPVMRIGDQLEEALDAHLRLSPADKRACILGALRDVRLPDPEGIAASYPGRLSGGQRQRVMIACALMLEPALLIADEPTTALDVTTQAQILELIRDLQAKRGTAVLFITHDFGVVSQIADRVAVMQLGEIVEAGAAAEVLGHPRHDYTRKLIAAIPHGMPDTAREAARQPVLLDVRDLHKTYVSGGGSFRRGRETAAMRGISFTLQRGEVLGLVGESGSQVHAGPLHRRPAGAGRRQDPLQRPGGQCAPRAGTCANGVPGPAGLAQPAPYRGPLDHGRPAGARHGAGARPRPGGGTIAAGRPESRCRRTLSA